MKTVYVIGGDTSVERMFRDRGWSAKTWDEPLPDLICFTGGADIQPHLYGEENLGKSHCNPERDKREIAVFENLVGRVPMVGICRGGQLLNVLGGGKMIQHIGPYHGIVRCVDTDGEAHEVDVCHHQGIIRHPEKSISILARDIGEHPTLGAGVGLTYGCWYPKIRSLCFQPHPEWGHRPTANLFFDLIKEFCFD